VRHLLSSLLALLLLPGCPTEEEPRTLVGIEVSPAAFELAAGRTLQLEATAIWSDGARIDVTMEAEWFASHPDVADVYPWDPAAGLVTTFTEGTSTVTATVDMTAASAVITVLPAELDLLVATPVELDLPVGAGHQLLVAGSYSDGALLDVTEQVTWTTGDVAVAEVADGSELPAGYLVAVGAGETTVVAELDGQAAEVSVTVREAELESIALSPLEPEVPLGAELDFAATGTWSDGSQADVTGTASWSSSDPSHLDFLGPGSALATGLGGALVEVAQDGVTASTVVTVVEAELAWLVIDPPTLELALGTSWPLTVTGGYTDGVEEDRTAEVAWSSDDAAVVTTSNDTGQEGRVLAVGVGETTVRARLGDLEAFAPVEVTEAQLIGLALEPQLPSVALGLDVAFAVTGLYTDGGESDLTDVAAWSVDPLTVAIPSPLVGQEGVVLTVDEGVATVAAEVASIQAWTTLVVLPPELVSLAVTPADAVMAVGEIVQYEATGSYTDGGLTDLTPDVFWATSAPGFATADNLPGHEGEVTALAQGSVTVLASLSPIQGSTTLTVAPPALVSLAVEPATPTLPVGGTLQLTASGLYTDGEEEDLTAEVVWSSMEPGTVTTSNDVGTEGVITGVAVGTATVIASSGDTTASVVVEVTSE